MDCEVRKENVETNGLSVVLDRLESSPNRRDVPAIRHASVSSNTCHPLIKACSIQCTLSLSGKGNKLRIQY